MRVLEENVGCELCTSREFDVVFPNTLRRSLEESDFSVFGEQREHPQLVRCRRCRLIYAHPRDCWGDLAEKYRRLPTESYQREALGRRVTAMASIALMQEYVARGRVLDVGCFSGLFLHSLPPGFEPYGVEPSLEAAAIARQLLGEHAIHVGTLETAQYPDEYFDAVTMWDVIEHLPSPRAALQKVARLMKPGAHLLLVTPDIGSMAARLLGRRWPHLIRQHLFYFDRYTLTQMLDQCGFSMVRRTTYGRHFTLGYLAERSRLVRPRSAGNADDAWPWPIHRLAKISIQVDLRDCLLVVARRLDALTHRAAQAADGDASPMRLSRTAHR